MADLLSFPHFDRYVRIDDQNYLHENSLDQDEYRALLQIFELALTRAFEDGHDNGYLVGKEDGRERP